MLCDYCRIIAVNKARYSSGPRGMALSTSAVEAFMHSGMRTSQEAYSLNCCFLKGSYSDILHSVKGKLIGRLQDSGEWIMGLLLGINAAEKASWR